MELNELIYKEGLVKFSIDQGLRLIPLMMKWDMSKGCSLMNPSIYNDDGKLKCNIRIVNYSLSHSEFSKYPHWSGPLQYIHPENDVVLRTENLLVDLNDNFDIVGGRYIRMMDLHEPNWEFIGLEDARLVRWDGKLYLIGVRRDIKDNGEGRMELTEIDGNGNEVDRVRMPSTYNNDSYCEKNWMPILDSPYTFIKWTSPTEIAQYDRDSNITRSKITSRYHTYRDIRGGSQVIKWKDYYVAFGHSVDLWKPYAGEKTSRYMHHIIVWDKDFNPIYVSKPFHFADIHIEFCCGLCEYNGLHYVSFSTRDNSAYILEIDLESILGSEIRKFEKNSEHRKKYKLFYDWAEDLDGLQSNLNLAEFLFNADQISSSITHYLKVAENAPDNEFELKYHCLSMVSLGYEKLGRRWLSGMQFASFAKTEQPDRPESYAQTCRVWMDKLYNDGVYSQYDWEKVFENSKIGLLWATVKDYPESKYYGGINELKTYYIKSLDRIGKVEEVKEYIKSENFDDFKPDYKDTIIDVCNSLEIMSPFNDFERVRDKIGLDSDFISDNVLNNKSQVFQDIFAIITKESKDGLYLELGSGTPVHHNNSWLLERLGWKGTSIEHKPELVTDFSKNRRNKVILDNAISHDYRNTIARMCDEYRFDGKYLIDYLSLDVDDAGIEVLYRLPFESTVFGCITFEHDFYKNGRYIKEESRKYLESLGYKIIGEDIKYNTKYSFEDWYIHPDLVNDERVLSNIYKLTKYVQSI